MSEPVIPSDPKEIAALMDRWACAETQATYLAKNIKQHTEELKEVSSERDRLWGILKECVQPRCGSATRPSRLLAYRNACEVTTLEWCKDIGRPRLYIEKIIGIKK